MESSASDFNGECFVEYNPHPYRGGYDIGLTYGQPLQPSSAICYPISSSASSPVSEPPPSAEVAERRDSSGSRGDSEKQGGEDYPSAPGVKDFDEPVRDFRPLGPEPYLDTSGNRPVSAPFEERRGGRNAWDQDPLSWAVDYLFSYLQTYGEKRDESHNYANLNYAYERHQPQEALLIQSSHPEALSYEKLCYHEDYQEEGLFGSSHTYEEKRDENRNYGNLNYAYEQPQKALLIRSSPHEALSYENSYYPEDQQDEGLFGFFHSYGGKRDESSSYGNLSYGYETQQSQEALLVRSSPHEASSYEKPCYDKDFLEESLFGFLPTYGGKKDESYNYGNLSYAYEKHQPQESLLIQFSPPGALSYENPSCHDDYQKQVCPYPLDSSGYGGDSYQWSHSETAYVDSPYSPTSYYEDGPEQVYPRSENAHALEKYCHEQPLSVQHESAENVWLQSLDLFGLFASHERPGPEDVQGYGGKFQEKPLENDNYSGKSWYQSPINNEFYGVKINDINEVKSFHNFSRGRSSISPHLLFFNCVVSVLLITNI